MYLPTMQPLPPPPAATFLPPPPPPPPQSPSLSTALSDLTTLLHRSATTLNSLPTPIQSLTTSNPQIPCPSNPNHLVPPQSISSHYLNCPNCIDSQTLAGSFFYRNCPGPVVTPSVKPPPLVNLPMVLSIECVNCGDNDTDPSVVITPSVQLLNSTGVLSIDSANCNNNQDPYAVVVPLSQTPPLPSLPGVLPIECVDCDINDNGQSAVTNSSMQTPQLVNSPRVLPVDCGNCSNSASKDENFGFGVDFIGFFPSEIWAVRSEMEGWGGGFPTAYSSRVLRAIISLRNCELLHLCQWVVVNSPRYGVIIDFLMGDYVVLLVRLCLKAIVREAFRLRGSNFRNGGLEMEEFSYRSFECPVLVEVMMWLALQFCVLYGEVNGKYLAVDVLKECILDAASRASLIPLDQNKVESTSFGTAGDEVEEPVQSIEDESKKDDGKGQTVGNSKFSISQVAAAVAALHECLTIEEKLKAFRNPRPVSAYQRYMEHEYVSKTAQEERQKRPDYRPIIDHDGLLWQRSRNQERNKVKTKEELLAEERDYKRRRMSYRGKKLKQNTIEVMRDIINEYMEEIKIAGGIGDMSKAVDAAEASASETLHTHANATDVSGSRTNLGEFKENRGQSHDYKKELNNHHELEDLKDIQYPNWDHGPEDFNKNVNGGRRGRDDYSGTRNDRDSRHNSREQMHFREKSDYVEASGEGSSKRSHQSQSDLRDRNFHKRDRDDLEHSNRRRERDEHERTSRRRERYEDKRESKDRMRSKRKSTRTETDEDEGRHSYRKRSKTKRSSSSHSELHEFEDRYDPAESHDFKEEHF